MRRRWAACVLACAVGCHGPAPAPVRPLPLRPSVAEPKAELPFVEPAAFRPDLSNLPKADLSTLPRTSGFTHRGLSEPACVALAARHAAAANLLDDENRIPPGASTGAARLSALRGEVRYFAALELRNEAVAAALERFFQLAETESRAGLARESFPILDGMHAKAVAARKADVRYPLDAADVRRQISQLMTQLEQADGAVRVLNIDLRRRLGLPSGPADERLWPTGDFGIDPTPVDAEPAVTAALADRPELRGLRTLYNGLTADTLAAAREQLRGAAPAIPGGRRLALLLALAKCLGHAPDPAATDAAELEVRRKQLFDTIADRERAVADETRAAAAMLNAQAKRATLARDRADAAKAKVDDMAKQREAKLPGADLLEFQARLDWLQARSGLVAEVMAWHQARVKLKAAQGWLAWEAMR